jgi:cAMP-specific phosphodiesterase
LAWKSRTEPLGPAHDIEAEAWGERGPSTLTLLTKRALTDYTAAVFAREGTAARLGIDPGRLRTFIARVGRHYRDNPYHNFHHAADTVNTMAWMITRPVLRRELPLHTRLLLLLTALVHDVEHPGHNNAYEVQIDSPLARKYANEAVLEAHSRDVSFALLAEPGGELFAPFGEETVREWRRILDELIMATDFSRHRAFLDEWCAYMASHPADFSDPVFLSWVTRALIKGADIANTTKPFAEAKLWGQR